MLAVEVVCRGAGRNSYMCWRIFPLSSADFCWSLGLPRPLAPYGGAVSFIEDRDADALQWQRNGKDGAYGGR